MTNRMKKGRADRRFKSASGIGQREASKGVVMFRSVMVIESTMES
jgi:hypothetical protein